MLLLQELKNALHPAGLIVTIAVGATSSRVDNSYDIPGIVPNVDFINLMTYDLHGSWDHTTGINAPLYAGCDKDHRLNVDACVKYWLAKGCPKDKLIVGIPTYGRTFTLQNPSQNGINAPSVGPGQAGKYTRQAGFLGFNEILMNGWPRKWQADQKVPYAFNGNQWVGYDDKESVTEKAKYILSLGLGGCMFWSIETDDFHHGYPLISTAHHIVHSTVTRVRHQQDFTTNISMPISKQRDPIEEAQQSIQAIIQSDSQVFVIFFVILVLLYFVLMCTYIFP